MEENIKDRLILILIIITVIFFIGAVGSCSNAARMKSARNKEMATRLTAEEERDKIVKDRLALEDKAKQLEQQLSEVKAAYETDKKALYQEKLVNQSLKDEIEKLTKFNEKLEESLKQALVADKSTKPKK